jgi:maltose/moltooligosaccharide transporter
MANEPTTGETQKAVLHKPKLTTGQIISMSFGFLGIQCGFALQSSNTSRILQSFGADVDQLPAFWVVAPIMGMIVQPLIGHYSDRTWNRMGRRKPYFLTGALLSALALILLPNSGNMAGAIPALWIGAGFFMIMDASFNVAMEPFRALVADNLPDSQRAKGFAIQACLIGIGAVAGSYLPGILARMHFSQVSGHNGVADNIKYAYYIGSVIFILAILITVVFSKEYPPAEYERYHGHANEKEEKAGLGQIAKDFRKMPKTMRQMGLVQFFSWFAMFSMWAFAGPAVATHIFGLTGDYVHTKAGNDAGNIQSNAFGVYNAVGAIYALCLTPMARRLGRKATHALSLLAGGIGLISIFFVHGEWGLYCSMVGVGLAWASILAMPYVILSGSIPAGKMGIYMGIFNFFITFPQIVNGICGGWIEKHIFAGQSIYSIVLAGFCLLAAAISVLFVYDGGAIRMQQEKAGFYAERVASSNP